MQSVEASLKIYIQIILTYYLFIVPILLYPNEVAKAFSQLKQEGKVRHFGVSNFLPSQFNMLNSYLDFPLITNQIEVSALRLEHFEKEQLTYAKKNESIQ